VIVKNGGERMLEQPLLMSSALLASARSLGFLIGYLNVFTSMLLDEGKFESTKKTRTDSLYQTSGGMDYIALANVAACLTLASVPGSTDNMACERRQPRRCRR